MTKDGLVFGSGPFKATPHERAKVAIARDVLYGTCSKPDSSVECEYEREKLRLVYDAGYQEGLKGPTHVPKKYPFLHKQSLSAHAETEFNMMLGYMQHLSETLHQYGGGNPTMQTMSDIVTLADRMPYLSVGHNVMCPRTHLPMSINTGFAQVTDKTDRTTAAMQDKQALRFLGARETDVSHSIRTDAAAKGIGPTLDELFRDVLPEDHPLHLCGYTTALDDGTCMMHDMSKVVLFMNGQYGYKDGRGNWLWEMEDLTSFNGDFETMVRQFRTKEGSKELMEVSAMMSDSSAPKIRFASNFNVTRCTGDMKQHINAVRLRKAIIAHEGAHVPEKTKHSFKGERWNELVEIMALEQLVGKLAFKAQHETAATAGYWHMWLTRAYLQLCGIIPFDVVNLATVTSSTVLPTVKRSLADFTPLARQVQARAMVEFKRRFAEKGDGAADGTDADVNWRPPLSLSYALPVMVDPRLCIVQRHKNLNFPKDLRQKYMIHLHEMHYVWYLNSRYTEIKREKARVAEERLAKEAASEQARRDAEHQASVLRAAAQETPPEAAVECISEEDNMYDVVDSDEEMPEQLPAVEVVPESLLYPITTKEEFLLQSKVQYAAYVEACMPQKNVKVDGVLQLNNGMPWHVLYPDQKYRIPNPTVKPPPRGTGTAPPKATFWPALVWDIDPSPVWNILKEGHLNSRAKFGFFPDIATHSKANVGRLAASSFCERVNSAGKIVLSNRNLKMLPAKIEERVMLRMNKKWVAHMRKHYAECNAGRILELLQRSHDALADLYEVPEAAEWTIAAGGE
jgi:hypothetical protein